MTNEEASKRLLLAAEISEQLSIQLKELAELVRSENKDQLNCGLNMLSVYGQLMCAIESDLHSDCRNQIEDFRKNI